MLTNVGQDWNTAWWTQLFCSMMFGISARTLKAGAGWTACCWNQLKACSLSCLVFDVGWWLGPQLRHRPEYLCTASLCACLGFLTAWWLGFREWEFQGSCISFYDLTSKVTCGHLCLSHKPPQIDQMSCRNTGISNAVGTIIFLNINGQQNNLSSLNFILVTGIKQKSCKELPTAPPHQEPGGIHCGVPIGWHPMLILCALYIRTTPHSRLHQKDLS